MNLKKTPIVLLMVFISFNIYGQTIMVNGQKYSGKLNWNDFTGKVDKGSSFGAYTAYKFNTKFESVKFIGDSAVINGFDVILELDGKNTWAKEDKMTDELLVHEQGHFNIGILCVKEIMAKFQETKFTKVDYNVKIQKIINEASKKFTAMGATYDEETEHSKNIDQQKKWNSFFEENLANK